MAFRNQGGGTRIAPEFGDYVSGDVILAGGIGMHLRNSDIDTQEIVFDAPAVDKDAPAGLFIPTLASWPPTTLLLPNSPTYLTMLEALIAGTTPAAGTDTSNCRAMRARGTVAGQQDLRLSTVGGRSFQWNGNDLSTIGEQTKANSGGGVSRGFLGAFHLSADARITNIGMHLWDPANGSPSTAGRDRVYEIVNADLTQVLATTDVLQDEASTNTLKSYDLLESVDLLGGFDYWIGVRMLGPGAQDIAAAGASGAGAGVRVYSGSVGDPTGPSTTRYIGLQSNDTGDWINPSLAYLDLTGSNNYPRYRLSGAPGGVLIDGNLVIETVSFGAPPNTPTELNIRLQWSTDI